MIPVMLNNLETEERRSNPATAHIAIIPPLADPDEHSGLGTTTRRRRARSRIASGVPGLSRLVRSAEALRFCSTGHRQAFWIAARRWTMRAVEVGLLNVECLKVP
jgi:hypothetical protein